MQNKGIKIALIVYAILLLFDVITTVLNGPLVKYLEINPLYNWLGVAGITVFNLGLIYVFYILYYATQKPVWRYVILLILAVLCVIRGIICWNNLLVFLHPPTLAQAAAVTQAHKTAQLKGVVWSAILMYLPGALAYLAFSKDHKITGGTNDKTNIKRARIKLRTKRV